MGIQRFSLGVKAFWQLGWRASAQYGVYQAMLRTGLLRLLTPSADLYPVLEDAPEPLLFAWYPQSQLAAEITPEQQAALLSAADRIVAGEAPVFGGQWVALDFARHMFLGHWIKYKAVWLGEQDIKMLWEPGRFGWATVLARAYRLTGERRYAAAFWQHTEAFMSANLPNQGPHWSSAQEVALRLMALAFGYSIFAGAPESTPQRRYWLAGVLAAHAGRIPATLSYAHAQNNNHLLTEAAGLLTAAAVLPNHRRARWWRWLGWRAFKQGIARQVMPDGCYSQHSTNYHRLMLQAALWVNLLATVNGETLPAETRARLAAAVRWLHTLLDEDSGQVPNLGPNDGAYILPLTEMPFSDYRPVLQAASRAFLGEDSLPAGEWDQMANWLVPRRGPTAPETPAPTLRIDGERSWGYLRAARFDGRPGHADQLHFDLWWRGHNLALDAGTYLYNAPPPWQNAFSGTDVHNTVMVNRQHQMTAAGRFLWLDWAQGRITRVTATGLQAEQCGYARQGIMHRRTVTVDGDQWQVVDQINGQEGQLLAGRLHWLLPDWPWQLDGNTLCLTAPDGGEVCLTLSSSDELLISLARAGELLLGQGAVPPQRGWYSPTYAEKIPALSLAAEVEGVTALEFISTWDLK